MNVVVRPAAAADFEDACRWYENLRPGLGDEFLDAVDKTLDSVSEAPRSYRVVHRDTRRVLIRRFPYMIFYRIVGEDILILGCFHGKRDPRHWEGGA